MKFSTRFTVQLAAGGTATVIQPGRAGEPHPLSNNWGTKGGRLGLWLAIYGLIFSLAACSVGKEAVPVSAQTIVVSTAIAVETTTLIPIPTPTPSIEAQAAVAAALAASNAQTHARFSGTLSRDLKLFEFSAEYAAPQRFHFQMEGVEFIMVDDLFHVRQGDQWLQVPEEDTPALKKISEGLFNVTPTILYAQLLGEADLDGVATQVYEYIGRIKTSQIDRLQQVKVWVRLTDNLIVKREASYEADSAQVFEIQFVDYDSQLVVAALHEFIDLPTAQGRREGAWQEFSSVEGKFALLLPGTPKESAQAVATSIGPINFHLFMVESTAGTYMVAYGDYPPGSVEESDPEEVLKGAQAGAIANVKGVLVAEDAFTSEDESGQSYPGRAVRIAVQEGQGLIRMRMILVGNRLYQVTALGTVEIITNPTTNQFLDSFQLLVE